jgi:hypothetical protein
MARALLLVSFATVVIVLGRAPRTAEATGLCENTARTYEPPRLFSEPEQAFAVSATQAWCEETAEMNEVRGEIKLVELRDLAGDVIGVLSEARGKDAQRLTQRVGAFEAVAAGKLDGVLAARGFAPLAAITRGPARCEVRAAASPAPKETVNGFPATQVFVDVLGGGKRLARIDAGLAAKQRRGELVALGHAMAKRPVIAVWVRRPSCSGPPPGYFGPDDAGNCYPDDEIQVLLFDATKTPALAPCFAAAPVAPAAPAAPGAPAAKPPAAKPSAAPAPAAHSSTR